jgi:hypothetical protein
MAVHPDDKADHTAKKRAEHAAELAPDDVDTLYLVARTNEAEPGVTEAEVRQNERLVPLKRVVALEPTHAGALLDLAEFWSRLNPLPEMADEYSARALKAAPQSWRALGVRASVLDQHRATPKPSSLRKAAVRSDEGRFQAEAILALAEESEHKGDSAAKVALLQKARLRRIERAPDHRRAGLGLHHAQRRRRRDRRHRGLARALALRRVAHARDRAAGRILRAARRRAQADRDALRCARRNRKRTSRSRASRSAQRHRDRRPRAAEVLRLDPGYDKARRQRQLLAPSRAGSFRGAVPLGRARQDRHRAALRRGNDHVQVVDRTTVWKVETDGTEHQYEHVLLQVENSGGVKDLDNYWIGYPRTPRCRSTTCA